jgi:ATP/maltotriose-dependent transcriptional regulator MalT
MQKSGPLIRTKLHLPFTRPELVPRPRLQGRIAEGLRGPLTLITAPAGFGKTTLVASYIASCGIPVAWLSLDKDDNQIRRFLTYLVATLQMAALSMRDKEDVRGFIEGFSGTNRYILDYLVEEVLTTRPPGYEGLAVLR